MTVESEIVFWVVAGIAFVVGVAVLIVGAFYGAAAYIILRDRGRGTFSSSFAIMAVMFSVPGVAVWAAVARIPSGPSPPTDPVPVLLVFIACLAGASAGVLCWAVARAVPKLPRRDGGPRRRFRYGMWGAVIGVATLPLAGVMWWANSWVDALRAPTITVPAMFALFALEHRARNRIDDDTDLGEFVLSLRGFADDLRLTIRSDPAETRWAEPANRNYVNLEQFVSDEMEKYVARLVAFGSPRDKIPGGGAGRVYAPEAGWQTRVRDLAVAARAIIMQIGETRSLSDELAIIRENGLATKLFVLTAPADRSNAFFRWFWRRLSRMVGWPEPTWSGFATLLSRNGFDPGTGDPGPGAVVTFDSDGRQVVLRRDCNAPRDYAMAIADRLHIVNRIE